MHAHARTIYNFCGVICSLMVEIFEIVENIDAIAIRTETFPDKIYSLLCHSFVKFKDEV